MMATAPATWPGTDAERYALLAAINHHCHCVIDAATERVVGSPCGAHSLLLTDQSMGHLVFVRRLQARLVAEEWVGVYEPEERCP